MRALLWRFVEWRLARAVPADRLDAVLGDLTADWASHTRTLGRLRANAWLLREASSVASAYRVRARDATPRRALPARLAADLAADLRYALRLMRRQPVFAARFSARPTRWAAASGTAGAAAGLRSSG